MDTLLLHGLTPDEFYDKIRLIVSEELKKQLKQEQLLTKDGALKLAGISNVTLVKAIKEGIVKPQLVKGYRRALYLESEILKIEKGKRKSN